MVNLLEVTFPRLAQGRYTITSPKTKRYNCIAWAAGDADNWWWPGLNTEKDEYWPATVVREETIEAFQQAFAMLGYVVCQGEDLETGFEKIAVFAR